MVGSEHPGGFDVFGVAAVRCGGSMQLFGDGEYGQEDREGLATATKARCAWLGGRAAAVAPANAGRPYQRRLASRLAVPCWKRRVSCTASRLVAGGMLAGRRHNVGGAPLVRVCAWLRRA